MRNQAFMTLISLALLGSCSMMPDRSFFDQMDDSQMMGDFFAPREDFNVVPGDSGHGYRTREEVVDRTPMEAHDREVMEFDQSLEQELDKALLRQSEAKLKHYHQYKKYLSSTSEELYFLRLRTIEQRTDYLDSRGYLSGVYNVRDRGIATIHREVVIGMSKSQVVKVWGEPDYVDVSGNPSQENERWAYHRNGSTRYIYFESGQVGGWSTE